MKNRANCVMIPHIPHHPVSWVSLLSFVFPGIYLFYPRSQVFFYIELFITSSHLFCLKTSVILSLFILDIGYLCLCCLNFLIMFANFNNLFKRTNLWRCYTSLLCSVSFISALVTISSVLLSSRVFCPFSAI